MWLKSSGSVALPGLLSTHLSSAQGWSREWNRKVCICSWWYCVLQSGQEVWIWVLVGAHFWWHPTLSTYYFTKDGVGMSSCCYLGSFSDLRLCFQSACLMLGSPEGCSCSASVLNENQQKTAFWKPATEIQNSWVAHPKVGTMKKRTRQSLMYKN